MLNVTKLLTWRSDRVRGGLGFGRRDRGRMNDRRGGRDRDRVPLGVVRDVVERKQRVSREKQVSGGRCEFFQKYSTAFDPSWSFVTGFCDWKAVHIGNERRTGSNCWVSGERAFLL